MLASSALLLQACGVLIYERPDDLRVVSLHGRMEPDDRFVIDVRLATNYNFARFVKAHDYNTSWDQYFCDKPDYAVALFGSGIVDDADPSHEISALAVGPRDFDTSDKPLYLYRVSINGIRKKTDGKVSFRDKPGIDVFDLRKDAQDICLRFAGGNELTGFKSNTVVIPKADIEAAVRDLPPPLAD